MQASQNYDHPDLDAWLDEPQIRTHHRRRAAVGPHALWKAASEIRVCDAPRLGRVLRWRIPGIPPDRRYQELFASYPFVLLDGGETWSLSGLCGRPWTLRRDYPSLRGPGEFRRWEEPGTVRMLFAHWVEPEEDGSAIVSETRVRPVDRGAQWRMRALWSTVGHFQTLIGREALTASTRRAEAGLQP